MAADVEGLQRKSCSAEDLCIWIDMPMAHWAICFSETFAGKCSMHVDGPVTQQLCSKHAYGSAGVLLLLPTPLAEQGLELWVAAARLSTVLESYIVRLMRPVAAVNKRNGKGVLAIYMHLRALLFRG